MTTQEVYESLGRLLEERQTIGGYTGVIGLDFYVTSQYTSLRRSALIYPKAGLKAAAGRRVNTTFCTNGLLDEVKDNGVSGNAIANYEYIGGRVLKRTSRNGIALDLTTGTLTRYDTAGQPLQWKITGGNPGTPIALSFTHTYDNAGNKLTQNFNRDNRDNQTFTYESAARLLTMTRPNADSPSLLNRAQTWTLDGPGNWSNIATTPPGGTTPVNEARLDTSFNEYYQIGSSTYPTHDDNGNQTYDGAMNMSWDAMNRLTKWTTGSSPTYFWRYIYDAQNRRVAKYYIYYEEEPEAMLRDGEAKLYCAASAWTHGDGVNPYLGLPARPDQNRLSACNPQSAICNPQSGESAIRGEAIADYPQSAIEDCRGGSDWLDERATEALLTRAGVLCDNPQYPVYEKQTFAYDGWRVIQEHKKTDGNGIPMATAIPVARQFTYGNYLDEALTVDADTDSDGDCIDSGGSTRYYYHQNSLFSVAALSDASANYKEGYQYDPYGRHVRITDGNDGDTYVNFGTNDARSAGSTSNYGNPYMFTGQRYDSESGLYYYKNRYYSTSQGRFISRDPIGYRGGNNLYQYVLGAPLYFVDPTGLLSFGTVGNPQYDDVGGGFWNGLFVYGSDDEINAIASAGEATLVQQKSAIWNVLDCDTGALITNGSESETFRDKIPVSKKGKITHYTGSSSGPWDVEGGSLGNLALAYITAIDVGHGEYGNTNLAQNVTVCTRGAIAVTLKFHLYVGKDKDPFDWDVTPNPRPPRNEVIAPIEYGHKPFRPGGDPQGGLGSPYSSATVRLHIGWNYCDPSNPKVHYQIESNTGTAPVIDPGATRDHRYHPPEKHEGYKPIPRTHSGITFDV